MSCRYYLGIDPDMDESGLALWDSWDQQFIFIEKVPFWDLIHFLRTGELIRKKKKIVTSTNFKDYSHEVILEAGWLNGKRNFHSIAGSARLSRGSVDVGMNLAVGRKLAEFLEHDEIKHTLIKPGTQTLRGKDLKADQFQKLTGWHGQTNEDKRDAAMLVFKR